MFSNAPNRIIELKTKAEIEKMRVAGHGAGRVLKKVSEIIRPGITTRYIDDVIFCEINSLKMKPAFLGYRGFPASACVSINNELVHGIPRSDKALREGDIVSVDLGTVYDGFYGDIAATFKVGRVTPEAQKLINVTREALEKAIKQVKPGNRMGSLSWKIQSFVENTGFSVVRDYVGHGIGRNMHEEPAVPNFGEPDKGVRFTPGMVFAIEPMVNAGTWQVKILSDGWTVVTADGRLCAHFEHTVAVTENGCEVLTAV